MRQWEGLSRIDWVVQREGFEPVAIRAGLRVGRSRECEICIADSAVTRVHCLIRADYDQLTLIDQGRYGTLVNGQPVAGSVRLGLGDTIDICGHILVIQRGDAQSAARARPASLLESTEINPTGELSEVVKEHLRTVPPPGPRLVVDVVEDRDPAPRYRDAVQLSGRRVLLALADLRTNVEPPPTLFWDLKTRLRKAGTVARDAGAILEDLGKVFVEAGTPAAGVCVLADPDASVLSIACAGREPPWVLRGGARLARPPSVASVELGRIRGAQFPAKLLHFAKGDALMVPSLDWAAMLGTILVRDFPGPIHAGAWLRQLPNPPRGGCVLCLTFA